MNELPVRKGYTNAALKTKHQYQEETNPKPEKSILNGKLHPGGEVLV